MDIFLGLHAALGHFTLGSLLSYHLFSLAIVGLVLIVTSL